MHLVIFIAAKWPAGTGREAPSFPDVKVFSRKF